MFIRDKKRKREASQEGDARPQKRRKIIIKNSPAYRALLARYARHQGELIKKINYYLLKNNRRLISNEGHCQGLSILWLVKMEEAKVDWFYDTIDQIVICPFDKIQDTEIPIEKLLAQIEWAQEHTPIEWYLKTPDLYLTEDGKIVESFQRVLETDNSECGYYCSSAKTLHQFFKPRRNPIKYLLGLNDHATAVYQIGNYYYLYDANYFHNRANIFDSAEDLADEILNCHFRRFNQPVPDTFNLELNIFRVRAHSKELNFPFLTLFYSDSESTISTTEEVSEISEESNSELVDAELGDTILNENDIPELPSCRII